MLLKEYHFHLLKSVVSEETGIISLVDSGEFVRELTGDELKKLLLEKMDRTKNNNAIKTIVKKQKIYINVE